MEAGSLSIRQEADKFVEEQRRTARGQRLEQLKKDLTAERKMLQTVIWPVFKSFDDMIMEYEIVSTSGVKIYIDVFYEPLGLAFESEGFVAHAENISRERFSFERMRVRTMALHGYKYIPFSWDELDKKPELCRRALYELLGRYSGTNGKAYQELTVYERELLRFAQRLGRPFRLDDVSNCLQLGNVACRKVLRKLMEKKLIKPIGKGEMRHHEYILEDRAAKYML
jgi:hypothetical protein